VTSCFEDGENSSQPISTLSAASVQSGSEQKAAHSIDIGTVLKSRLARTEEILQQDDFDKFSEANLDVLQYITAKVSLRLVERLQSSLDPDDYACSSLDRHLHCSAPATSHMSEHCFLSFLNGE
jgi:hypothetical protein